MGFARQTCPQFVHMTGLSGADTLPACLSICSRRYAGNILRCDERRPNMQPSEAVPLCRIDISTYALPQASS